MKNIIKIVAVFVVVYVILFATCTGVTQLNLWLNSSWQQVFFDNWRWWNVITSPIDSLVYAYKLHHLVWSFLAGTFTLVWALVITGCIFEP
jgi:hypothetical protein